VFACFARPQLRKLAQQQVQPAAMLGRLGAPARLERRGCATQAEYSVAVASRCCTDGDGAHVLCLMQQEAAPGWDIMPRAVERCNCALPVAAKAPSVHVLQKRSCACACFGVCLVCRTAGCVRGVWVTSHPPSCQAAGAAAECLMRAGSMRCSNASTFNACTAVHGTSVARTCSALQEQGACGSDCCLCARSAQEWAPSTYPEA
jgi:hypothetical protein